MGVLVCVCVCGCVCVCVCVCVCGGVGVCMWVWGWVSRGHDLVRNPLSNGSCSTLMRHRSRTRRSLFSHGQARAILSLCPVNWMCAPKVSVCRDVCAFAGMLGHVISLTMLAFSPQFIWALVARFGMGLLNGNTPVCKVFGSAAGAGRAGARKGQAMHPDPDHTSGTFM